MLDLNDLAKTRRFSHVALLFLFSFLLYLGFAWLGISLATITSNTSPVWPATGVAISLVYLFGYRMAIPIWLGAFLINSNTGLSWPWLILIATGNMLEAVSARYFLTRMERSAFIVISGQANLLRYFLLAMAPPLISATLGTLALYGSGNLSFELARSNWMTWWVGDALGVLFVFPLVFELTEYLKRGHSWPALNFKWDSFGKWTGKAALLFLLIGLSNYFVFGTLEGRPYLFVIFLGLLLAAHFFSFLMIYVSAAAISVVSILMTQRGIGPFQTGAVNDSLIHLEFFLGMVWLTAVVLSNIKATGALRRPTWVLLIGWLLTGASFYSFFENSLSRSESYFDVKKTEAETMVRETMNGYIRLLESGAALLTVNENVTRADWKVFFRSLNLADRYPGLKGLGVVYALKDSQLKAFSEEEAQAFPGFEIHKFPGENMTQDEDSRFIVTLVEPLESNRVSVGVDISSEASRKEAAERARDTGRARLTEEVRLMQFPDSPGYLLMVPFYARGASLETISERRKNLKGFLFAPIEAKSFFAAATAAYEPDLNLVYARPMVVSGWGELLNSDTMESYVDLAGSTHRLIWEKPKGVFVRSNISASLVGFCGAFFTLILTILVASLENIRNEAERIAYDKTQEVIQRERLWRTLTEISPNGIFLTDKNSKAFYVNKRWVTITGISLEVLAQRRMREFIHPDDLVGTYKAWDDFVTQDKPEYLYEYRVTVNGQWRNLCVHTVALKDGEGKLLGYLGTMQDLTERHQHQLALAQSARMSSLGQMAGGVAHEINNPLAIISGRAEILRLLLNADDLDRKQAIENIDKIQTTVQRIAKIIRGLRSVVREAPNEPGVLYNIAQVFQDTLELCASRFQSHDVRLIYSPDIGQNIDVVGHPEQLTQVLLNLLNNAFDAVEEQKEKWVEIVSYKQNNRVIIEVSDSGPGISPANQLSLFDPFFTTKEVGKGTGLGLTISKSIIENQGGRLYIETNRTHTTFVIELGASAG